MHVEALKKGDIVLNHLQTKQLMETGRTFGNGKMYGSAYANGTAFSGMSAHAGTGGGGGALGGNKHISASSSNNSSNNSSSSTSNNNSSKKKSSSTSDADKVSKEIEKISKWVSNHFDWIEVKIDHLQKKADSYYTKAQNAIDQGLNRSSNYKTARSNIQKSIATNEQLITANQQGAARYMKQANTVKSKYDDKLKGNDKKNFDAAVKILNAGGKIDITKYSANVKQALEDYKNYYDKATECKYAVDDLNSTLIEQKQALFNLPIDQATAKVNKLEVALSKLQVAFSRVSSGKNTSIDTQNKELDVELANQAKQLQVQRDALTKTQSNLKDAQKAQASSQKSLTKDQKSQKSADKKVSSASADILKDSKISKTLTKSQKTALKKGKSISLSKSQKKKLSQSQQAKINSYNKKVKSADKIDTKISADKKSISAKNQTAQLAQDAYDTQLKTTNEAEKDYLEQIVANEKQKFDNVVSYFEKRTDLIEKQNSRKTAMGAYESAKDYNELISQTTQEIAQMGKQLDESVNSGKIQVGSDEWCEMKSQIVETETALENLNESARKAELQEMFERAAESVQKLIDKLQTVNSLITDDMKFDSDGKLTQNGALSLALDSTSLEKSKQNLEKYAAERDYILNEQWKDKGYVGSYIRGVDSELDELLDTADSNIKSEISNIQSYMQSLLSTGVTANEKERDAILEVVDAHKEALSKKKDYYDYDKKMKSQNKTISELERQAAGLRGSTDKADKAKLQQIEAQLKDAKDERDDMVKDHLYEMQTDALDQISDDINKYYEDMISLMKSSPQEMIKAIDQYMKQQGIDLSATGLANQISSVLQGYLNKPNAGTVIDQSGLANQNNPNTISEETQQKMNNFADLVNKLGTDYGSSDMTNRINQAMSAYNQMSDTEKSYVQGDYKKLTDTSTAHNNEITRVQQEAQNKADQEQKNLEAFQTAMKNLGKDYGSAEMTKKLDTAQNAYNALTEAQKKAMLSQYTSLIQAKEAHDIATKAILSSNYNASQNAATQGDGKINVGDQVTLSANDVAYKYSDKAKNKNTKNADLKKGAKYYIGAYKKSNTFPVQLFSDKARKHSVGWVQTKNLKGYASGTSSVNGDQLAWVNENWKTNGGEIIYRKSDGAMLMPLNNGDTVFSADKVQALYKMLETNPLPMNMGNMFSPRDLTTQMQTVNNTPVNYSDSHNIIVQGDLTRDTLPDLQTILKKSSEYTQNEIRKDLVKAGRKKTFH